jgi:hypothetical protein
MRLEIILVIVIVVATVVISLIVKKVQSPRKRARIYGVRCPRCNTDKVYWAGYSDRKQCKNGHIFT